MSNHGKSPISIELPVGLGKFVPNFKNAILGKFPKIPAHTKQYKKNLKQI